MPAFAYESRTVKYGPKDVVQLRCKLRYTTLIVLPENEKILDFVIGDKDMWTLEGTDNFAYLKPGKEGAATTVTLITQAGTIYSFVAQEGGGEQSAPPDVKVFVELTDERLLQRLGGPAPERFVPAREAEDLRRALADLQAGEIQRQQAFAAQYPLKLAFDYQFPKDQKPFYVSSVWHDDRATYIRSRAEEKPILYEVKDGQSVLVNYELYGDVYVVPKLLDEAHLAIGGERMTIRRRPR